MYVERIDRMEQGVSNLEPDWSLNGDDYEGLEWLDESPKPSKQTIEQAWPAVAIAIRTEAVERARQVAYRETAEWFYCHY